MNNVGITARWSRACVLLWASLWMLVVPLFHVHPGLDHRHGGVTHSHGVAIHTVLSLDLDGEFDDHHDSVPSEEAAANLSLVDHHSHSFTEHPEVGFALLNDSSERKVFKPFLIPAFAIDTSLVPNTDRQIRIATHSIPFRGSTIFVHEIRSRAPPLLLA